MASRDDTSLPYDAGRALADSIMDALETVALKLAGRIRAVQEDQAETRQELHALKQRVEALENPGKAARLRRG